MAKPCPACGGEGQSRVENTLQIKIPAGVDGDSQLRISGEGEAGALGGPSGDLYVVLRVAEHAFFKRDGTHLVCEMPIGVAQATLGATVEVPTLDGGKAKLNVPEGTQSGAVLRLKGQGVPGARRPRTRRPARAGARRGSQAPHLRAAKALRAARQDAAGAGPKDKDKSLLDRMKDFLG